MTNRARRLLRSGTVLCFLALVTGLAIPLFANPRMGLAAHVGGLMNGIFLLVVGLAWKELELSERAQAWTFRALVAGTFGNWASTVAAAAWGTRTLTPIAGGGFGAGRLQEGLVGVGLVAVGVAMLGATVALWVGLRERR
jgi:hydroxylaminobenzene mutase